MKYKVGDKVKIVQFTETAIDAPEHTIGILVRLFLSN